MIYLTSLCLCFEKACTVEYCTVVALCSYGHAYSLLIQLYHTTVVTLYPTLSYGFMTVGRIR